MNSRTDRSGGAVGPWRKGAFALLMSGVIALSVPLPAVAQQYSLDDWMTVSEVGEFQWAPDGRDLYFTSNAAPSGTMEVFKISARGGNPQQLTSPPQGERAEAKGELTLSPDGRYVYYTSEQYSQGYANVFRVPSNGGPAEAITFNKAVIHTSPAVSPDGRTLAFFARTGRGGKIYLKDLASGAAWPTLLLPDQGDEGNPTWAPDGRMAFTRGGDIWVVGPNGQEPRRIVEADLQGGNGSPVWSPDGRRIAFTRSFSGYSQVGVVDVASGKVVAITQEPNEHSSVSWSPDGAWLAYIRNDDVGMSRDVVVARSDGTGTPRILTKGKAIRNSPEFSPDGSTIAYIEETSTRTPDLWLVSPEGGNPRQLTHSMGRIDPNKLAQAQEIFYAAADNLTIPGVLLVPRNLDRSAKAPVIVRLHGHPGQWNHGFDLMDQYFVDRGFVLVKPDPRGSVGFGQGFHDLHIADYGGMEFRDVMGVLPFLDSLGYVDMTRKATWGGSGGGYMSLVIATEAPKAFQAQVIRAPVSDWKLLAIDRFGASGRAWNAGRTPRRERSEFGGSYAEIPEEYDRRSPINFAENVEVPQLLFQGLRDASVPPRQSELWVQKLKELGKGDLIDFVEYPDEVHSLRRYKATVRDRLSRMQDFLADHLNLPALKTMH